MKEKKGANMPTLIDAKTKTYKSTWAYAIQWVISNMVLEVVLVLTMKCKL